MKDIFTIAIQYEDTYIINIELIKSETENHLDIKLNLNTKCKEIKDRAFCGCESLKTVVIIAKEPPLLGEGVFPIEGISFEVPKGSIEKYRNENCWYQYKEMIQES